MRHSILLIGTALLAGHDVSTDYARERTLRIESETTITLETTSFEMLVDGEPMDRPFGGGGMAYQETRNVVLLDQHLESEEGRPTKVRRTFETIDAETSVTFGEDDNDSSSQGPLAGVVLELTVDEDGEVSGELVDGDAPDDEELLEGHVLELCLDTLLPDDEVDADETWELDAEAVRQALSLALGPKLFPTPEREPVEAGAGRGEGGRRGRGRRGGAAARFLQDAEWQGQATLLATDEEYDDEACTVIGLELEASGELPESGFGGGRRRERGFGLEPAIRLPVVESNFEVELEGRLVFSNASMRPVRFELKGTIATERSNEFDRQGQTMSMNTAQAGTFEQVITLSEE
jgi:hypothetical protein